MAHTLADYTTNYKLATIFATIDVGELAARLWSPSYYSRSGNVSFMDTFSKAALLWNPSWSAGGANPTLSTERVYMDSTSCKMVTTAGANDYVYMERRIPMPVDSRIGIEFTLFPTSTLWETTLGCEIYRNGLKHLVLFRYVQSQNAIQYYNTGGTFTEIIPSVYWVGDNFEMVVFKFVVDLEADEYVRCSMNNKSYSMAGIGIAGEASANPDSFNLYIRHKNITGGVQVLYVDSVIMTQNE